MQSYSNNFFFISVNYRSAIEYMPLTDRLSKLKEKNEHKETVFYELDKYLCALKRKYTYNLYYACLN